MLFEAQEAEARAARKKAAVYEKCWRRSGSISTLVGVKHPICRVSTIQYNVTHVSHQGEKKEEQQQQATKPVKRIDAEKYTVIKKNKKESQ